jgi:CDP-diacylglycerol---glycerol-3-phosphate 3-phosphatidyltransferase
MKQLFVKHAANSLTLLRLVSTVPILCLLYSSLDHKFGYALLIFGLVIPTDFLDGVVARALHQASEFGGFLDALSDKIIIYALLFSLFKFEVYTASAIFPMFIRDILVDGLRNYYARGGHVLPANIAGKAKFGLQSLSIITGLLYLHFEIPAHLWYAAVPNITLVCAFAVSLGGLPLLYKVMTDADVRER